MLNWIDISVFVGFFAVVIGVSMFKSRREKSSEDYFLAGRGLTWPLIGLSIVAANISTEQFVGMAGQGAGSVGLAVSNWQLAGTVGIVIIAFTLLPRFLKSGIYTMPEYLEYRYNVTARALMAIVTVVIYVAVLLTAVLYSGGLTLRTLFGIRLHHAVWAIGIIAALYTTWGGLKAVAWADLFQGMALLLGGLAIFGMGLKACGGWQIFSTLNADKLHMILPAGHPDLPWTGVLSGMSIVILYYCGLNQFIVQRNLAAKTLRDGQTWGDLRRHFMGVGALCHCHARHHGFSALWRSDDQTGRSFSHFNQEPYSIWNERIYVCGLSRRCYQTLWRPCSIQHQQFSPWIYTKG